MTTYDIEHIHGSDIRAEREEQRKSRASLRQAIAEIGVTLAMLVLGIVAWGAQSGASNAL